MSDAVDSEVMTDKHLFGDNKVQYSTSGYYIRLFDVESPDFFTNTPFPALPDNMFDLIILSIPDPILKTLSKHKHFHALVPTYDININNIIQNYGHDDRVTLFGKSNLKSMIVKVMNDKKKLKL